MFADLFLKEPLHPSAGKNKERLCKAFKFLKNAKVYYKCETEHAFVSFEDD